MTAENVAMQQFLTFLVAGEGYGVSLLEVREIIQFAPVTKMPAMPAWIRGVVNVRGRVVPVVDLSQRFGMGETAVGKRTCIVLVEAELDGERGLVGLLADAVDQVVDLAPEDIEPPPAFGTRVRVDYVQGMGRQDKKFVILLDLARLLSADELLAATQAPPAEEPAGAPAPPAPAPESGPERPPVG